jgi:hypothetical protein
MVSISRKVEEYIRSHPYIKQGIINDVINFSKLARAIREDTGIDNFDATLIAIRRYQYKLRKTIDKKPILNLLRKTSLTIRNKIIAVIVEPELPYRYIISLEKEVTNHNEIMHVIRGKSAYTLITSEIILSHIEKKIGTSIIHISKNLCEILLKSPKELETVPGVNGYLYSLFGENNINIVETMSCWTDTIIVIEETDLSKTMELLKFK